MKWIIERMSDTSGFFEGWRKAVEIRFQRLEHSNDFTQSFSQANESSFAVTNQLIVFVFTNLADWLSCFCANGVDVKICVDLNSNARYFDIKCITNRIMHDMRCITPTMLGFVFQKHFLHNKSLKNDENEMNFCFFKWFLLITNLKLRFSSIVWYAHTPSLIDRFK